MRSARWSMFLPALLLGAALVVPAHADHHLMQIEQVIGGVNGDITAQAVQLRMRAGFQNVMANGRMRVHDAAGLNPIMVIDFTTNVPNQGIGVRVLVLSAGMAQHLNGAGNADYIMTNPIPASYLAAGSLTFEDNAGTVWWRVSWGGANYTGTGAVNGINDQQLDGTFNPPFPNPLPHTTTQALITTLAAAARGNSTLQDYTVTAGNAVLTNNAGTARTVVGNVAGVGDPTAGDGVQLGAPSPNPASGSLSYTVSLPRDGHVRVEVYAVGGRLVRTLIDRELPAGHHPFRWESARDGGEPLASGVYYLRLSAAGVQRSRTFSMIR